MTRIALWARCEHFDNYHITNEFLKNNAQNVFDLDVLSFYCIIF
jgi:hypothetical protein